MLTRSIPIPGDAVAASRVRGRSRNSLLCWETVACISGSDRVGKQGGARRHALSRDTDAWAPGDATRLPNEIVKWPLRLHTAGRASAKGTRPRSDISAFGSKRPKKKSPNRAKIPVAAKGEPGGCGGCRVVAARVNKRLHRHFAPQITAQPRQSPSRSENTKGILFFPSPQS